MAKKTRVVVLFGGRSGEHEISCATAASVLAKIDRERYDVIPVGISPDGRWVRVPDDPALYALQDGHGASIQAGDKTLALIPGLSRSGAAHVMETQVEANELLNVSDLGEIDVVFPLLHGAYGEDGTLQGLLEMANVPYVGCGVAASAICMDKSLTKTILQAAGIAVGRWVFLHRADWVRDPDAVMSSIYELGDDLFVKPCRAGSSLGITHVRSAAELSEAIELALSFDSRVIVEAATAGLEVECAVLGGRGNAQPRTTEPGCIMVKGVDFYDYNTKYMNPDAVELQIPAPIALEVATRLREIAAKAFTALQCEGLARIDFFVDGENIVLNEVNTLPGFTPFSMYPALWANEGIGYTELLSELIEMALERPTGLR